MEVASYVLPGDAYLQVEDGQNINIGDVIAKLSKALKKLKILQGIAPC